jgi:hypothetical protein
MTASFPVDGLQHRRFHQLVQKESRLHIDRHLGRRLLLLVVQSRTSILLRFRVRFELIVHLQFIVGNK